MSNTLWMIAGILLSAICAIIDWVQLNRVINDKTSWRMKGNLIYFTHFFIDTALTFTILALFRSVLNIDPEENLLKLSLICGGALGIYTSLGISFDEAIQATGWNRAIIGGCATVFYVLCLATALILDFDIKYAVITFPVVRLTIGIFTYKVLPSVQQKIRMDPSQ